MEKIRLEKYRKSNKLDEIIVALANILDAKANALKVMKYHYGKNVINLIERNDNFKYEFIARQFLYQRVLCHNDVYVGNVLELKQSGKVVLIDFEYTSYNYVDMILHHFLVDVKEQNLENLIFVIKKYMLLIYQIVI